MFLNDGRRHTEGQPREDTARRQHLHTHERGLRRNYPHQHLDLRHDCCFSLRLRHFDTAAPSHPPSLSVAALVGINPSSTASPAVSTRSSPRLASNLGKWLRAESPHPAVNSTILIEMPLAALCFPEPLAAAQLYVPNRKRRVDLEARQSLGVTLIYVKIILTSWITMARRSPVAWEPHKTGTFIFIVMTSICTSRSSK